MTHAQANTACATNSGLFNLAVNSIIPNGTDFIYYEYQSDDQGIKNLTALAGDSIPVANVQPSFFPVATRGAECGAHVTDLSWADNNLLAGYEYIQITISGVTKYFVTGILNSSQTQANDPFTKSEVVKAACWAGEFTIGLNPFV
jgi:hypothetical protein